MNSFTGIFQQCFKPPTHAPPMYWLKSPHPHGCRNMGGGLLKIWWVHQILKSFPPMFLTPVGNSDIYKYIYNFMASFYRLGWTASRLHRHYELRGDSLSHPLVLNSCMNLVITKYKMTFNCELCESEFSVLSGRIR